MRLYTRLLFGISLLFSLSILQAQDRYAIAYQNEYTQLPENIDDFAWRSLDRSDRIQGGYYMWLQFYSTPVQEIQDQIKASPVELQTYINNKTYLAFVPANTNLDILKQYGVRSIVPVPNKFKLSENLRLGNIGQWAIKGDKIHVSFQHHDKVSTEYVLKELAEMDISVDQQVKKTATIDLLIPNDCLDELAALPFVKYVDVIDAPAVKEDDNGRGLHRSSNLDTGTPGDRNYDGTGIGVMVRDDGVVGPHIDFQGRIDNSATSNVGDEHGDGVAGILAGAGNLNPSNRGMAAGANIFVVDYDSDFTISSTLGPIQNGDVQITNSSYGNGCNAGYTGTTRTVDQQANTYPNLLHVFSAGNSNGSDCDYGAGDQWGNITGGHKQGKNVIATANTFSNGGLANSSSHGPAHDGRIKPDITAHGQGHISTDENNGYSAFGGTSGASPGIAGVAAQLYQAYRELNNDEMPEAALIKATMLNTANDYGNRGPDFRFGWGMVNGLRAVKLLEDGRFLNDTITQGEKNTHVVSIPDGTVQVRFMVYWRDPAAASGASSALVNDIDLQVIGLPDSNGMADTLLPYVLDPTPNPVNLNRPATNGVDRLNNMEQVVINYPAGGDYTLDVTGFDIPVGPQSYYIVYEVITQELTVTYPNSSVSLVSGTSVFVQWDAVNVTGSYIIEYSNDNGTSWNAIGFAPAGQRLESWTVPQGITGQALVRVISGDLQDVSDTTFSYAPRVEGLEVTSACLNSMTFTWDSLSGANMYDLYILGEKYMEVRGSTSATSITIPDLQLGEDVWYAIAARDTLTGMKTRRTNAQLFNDILSNCQLGKDMVVTDILNVAGDFTPTCDGANDSLVRVQLYNNGMVSETGFRVNYQVNNGTIVTEVFTDTLAPEATVEFIFAEKLAIPAAGTYQLIVSIETEGDEYADNDNRMISMYVPGALGETPLEEGFETTGFPPEDWQIQNDDESFSWEESTVSGIDDANTTVAYINNYDYNAPGAEDYIYTLVYAIDEETSLSFDIAKAQYSARLSDAFRVDISDDCGASFAPIYYKEALDLSTLSGYNTTSGWTPQNPDNWRTETINLDAYAGQKVMVRFVNINGYGNSTFIDNINISGPQDSTSAVNDLLVLEGVKLFPNPAKDQLNVSLPATVTGMVELQLLNSFGQVIKTERKAGAANHQLQMNVASLPSGMYYLRITADQRQAVKKVMIE